MTELIFLQDLAIVMVISAPILILCRRLGLPVVLGYILAGVVIGPHTPPFPLIRDLHSIHTLSELGVIFLLFAIGLEFSLSKLLKVGLVAFFAATLEILLMIWIGYSIGILFGWNFMNSLFLGAILSISSTTIIAKILMEMKIIQEKFAQVILGILVVEDLLAIIIIAILSGIASTGSLEMQAVGVATIKVTAFILGILAAGFLIIPKILRQLDKANDNEMMVITVLGLCFAVSLMAAKLGFSVALGAFLVGAIIAETKYAKSIIHQMEPIRDMFTAIFFVSVGMLIDPSVLAKLWFPILIITVVTIIGKVLSCSFATFLTGYSSDVSLKVGLGLAQIGEFSFIIARLGEETQVTSPLLYPLAVSVSSITALTTPLLMRNTEPIIRLLEWITPKPLVMAFSLYTSWIEKIGGEQSERKTAILDGVKALAPRLLLYASVAVILFYGISYSQEEYQFFSVEYAWAVAAILIFLPFMGFAYTLDRLVWDVLFLNLVKAKSEVSRAKDVTQMMHNSFRFLLILFTGGIFLAVASSFLPRMPLVISVIGLILISGLFLWNSVRKIYEKIEKVVLGAFDQEKIPEKKQTAAQNELLRLIQKEYPWDVETLDFMLPYKTSALNQKIKDLRLRNETGASIIAIYRGEEVIANPSADTELLPGDVLLLMGDKQQINLALRFFKEKVSEPPL